MSRLFETIRYEDGEFFNVPYHQARMNRALLERLGTSPRNGLIDRLRDTAKPFQGLYRCRVDYDGRDENVTFIPYTIRPVRTLKVVRDDQITYDHKSEDRLEIIKDFEQRGNCDDVIIVKQGLVTDSSMANIVFKKKGTWVTPRYPLLRGTMRQSLLDRGMIVEADIRAEEIMNFDSFRLINAMLQFDSEELLIKQIIFE